MNRKQLLKNAGVRNDIIKEVEKRAKQSTEQQEQEHQERAINMTKMLLNEALRYRKEHGPKEPPSKTIIIPDDI